MTATSPSKGKFNFPQARAAIDLLGERAFGIAWIIATRAANESLVRSNYPTMNDRDRLFFASGLLAGMNSMKVIIEQTAQKDGEAQCQPTEQA